MEPEQIQLKLKYRTGGRAKKTVYSGRTGKSSGSKKAFRGVTPPSKVMCVNGANGHALMLTREQVTAIYGHAM